ncbi:MAG: AMP-binding protein [Pseudolabrys sp.]|nr:AMP-binding protein [Pseudolabrys sp.]
MTEHYDALETREPILRERELFLHLPQFLAHAMLAPGWAAHLKGIDPKAVDARPVLAKLPLLRKSALPALQKENPPFGGLTVTPISKLRRVQVSPGPIFEPEGETQDYAGVARALFATGVRSGDVLHNSFSYHLTPGAWMFDAAAAALGCAVIPGGIGNTEQQVETIAHLRPSAYSGTPDFLKTLLDTATKIGKDVSCLKRALVSGAALPASLRVEFDARGINALQCYAAAEVGVIAYESQPRDGLIVNENVIVEIVRPGTGDPVAEGEVGEVVVTTFNPDYPMIRLATGDLSAFMSGQSICGRTNRRIKGWMGRADQTTKIKGMFVRPELVSDIGKRHPQLGRLRLVVSRDKEQDAMTLMAEAAEQDAALEATVAQTLQAITKLKGKVKLVPPGALPNDGKVIADERPVS